MSQNLYLVDDHFMLRKGISAYLVEKTSWRVTGSFATAQECLDALKLISTRQEKLSDFPEIIIIDIQLGTESGFNLVRQIRKEFPDIKIIIYSMFDTLGFVLQAKDLGAKGFISKASTEKELVNCLNQVSSGGTYFKEAETSIQNELDSIVSVLKDHEKKVFELILQEKSNDQIKDELFLSIHTVENKVSYILNIANCKSRKELIEKFR